MHVFSIEGSQYNDSLTASSDDNTLNGNGGADSLAGCEKSRLKCLSTDRSSQGAGSEEPTRDCEQEDCPYDTSD